MQVGRWPASLALAKSPAASAQHVRARDEADEADQRAAVSERAGQRAGAAPGATRCSNRYRASAQDSPSAPAAPSDAGEQARARRTRRPPWRPAGACSRRACGRSPPRRGAGTSSSPRRRSRISTPPTSVTAPTTVTPSVTLSTTSRSARSTSRTSIAETFGMRCDERPLQRRPRAAGSSATCDEARRRCAARARRPGRAAARTRTRRSASSSQATSRMLVTRARSDAAGHVETHDVADLDARVVVHVLLDRDLGVERRRRRGGRERAGPERAGQRRARWAASASRYVRPNSRVDPPCAPDVFGVGSCTRRPSTPTTRARSSGRSRGGCRTNGATAARDARRPDRAGCRSG